MEKIKSINWIAIGQMLIVAALSTTASGYVSGRIVEQKMEFAILEIQRINADVKETRIKLEDVQLRQARAISQAESIHGTQDRRIDRLETRR
jgi:outer membrane murein-binding lipoprotein Lpp